MDDVECEVIALQGNGNREWTQIAANSWERDRPGRCGVRLAPRSESVSVALRRDKDHRALQRTGFQSIGVHSRLDAHLLDISRRAFTSR
jgi:hypothetical protein